MINKSLKEEKAITLVALIITIIVLLILAMVSISLVMNGGIIDKSKSAVDKYSEEEIGEQLKLVYSEYQMSQYSGTPIDVQAKLREIYGNDTTASIANGKLTATINGKTYLYDASIGLAVETKVYAVGDVVTLGGEDFYVIEASPASSTTVKLLAKYNVQTTSGEGQYTQTSEANKLAFDDDSNDYATSQIKAHVDLYKTALEGKMGSGKTTQEVRLMTKGEVEALDGNSSGNSSECPTFINEQNYWLGTPSETNAKDEWYIRGEYTGFGTANVDNNFAYGLRPVVIVKKSNI